MSPRTGRPKVDNPKKIRFSICIDKQQEEELTKYCLEHNVTKGEAIRQGINLLLHKQK